MMQQTFLLIGVREPSQHQPRAARPRARGRALRSAVVAAVLLPVLCAGARAAVLWDNGPLVTSVGTGFGGADESVVQNVTLGDQTLGVPHDPTTGQRVADELTIADPIGWQIDTITFYAYQNDSGTTSTITSVNLRIWDGVPGAPGSNVVFGDTTTNRLQSSTFTNIYRDSETTLQSNRRPIMADVVTVGTSLGPGTYWLDWQTDGSLASNGPFAPPVTISGQAVTGNGRRFDSVSWIAYVDVNSGNAKGVPFVVEGQLLTQPPPPSAIPTLGPFGMLLLLAALGGSGLWLAGRSSRLG